MPRSIGYARCSTTHQDTTAQTHELRGAGCVEVFAETVSSLALLEKRHQLRACLELLQEGDELVISKLDRLGRSQVEVINRLAYFQEKGIHIRTLIRERTREPVENRRRMGGNPRTSDKKERLVLRLRSEGEFCRSIRDQTRISVSTIQRILKDVVAA